MATFLLAEFSGSELDGWPTPTVPTVSSCMSLPFLMHPWKARWGD